MRASKNSVRLSLERLEAREVLDASISVSGGALIINGTSLADAFRVSEVEVAGGKGYQVEALAHQGRQSTFNNGKTSGVFKANRIAADLGAGNDLLILQDLSTRTTMTPLGRGFWPTPGDVNVYAGAGSDQVWLTNADVKGKVRLDLGSGDDLAVVKSSSVSAPMEVWGRSGADFYYDLGGNAYGADGLGLKLSSLAANHRESTDGQTTRLVNPTAENPLGEFEWVAKGDATHLGRYDEVGSHHFTAPDAQGVGLVLNGKFTSTAADGASVSGIYFGTYRFVSADTVEYNVTAIYQSGTGRLAGVTGSGDVVARLDVATGTFHFDTNGTWTFA